MPPLANSTHITYHLPRPRQGLGASYLRCRHHTPSEGDSADANLNARPSTSALLRGLIFGTRNRGGIMTREIIIKDTHRGLWYEDGVLKRVLEAGRYELPRGPQYVLSWRRYPKIEIVVVDVRERELTIKGQEILTSDKVAIRVSIVVQFRVTDPAAAMDRVAEYEDRLYSDVQLAARRSLASMTLENILTNRTRLSEDILAEVLETAAG